MSESDSVDPFILLTARPPAEPSVTELKLARRHLRSILHSSILTGIYGIDAAVDRATRISQNAWNTLDEHSRPTFHDFTTARFPVYPTIETSQQSSGVTPGAFSFFDLPCALDAPVYTSPNRDSSGYYIADIIVSDFSRLIPSQLFVPYGGRGERCHQVLSRLNPIPLWFFREDGVLGFPIKKTASVKLLHGQEDLCLKSNNKPTTTLRIKLDWPNYRPHEKQIHVPKSRLNNFKLDYLANRTARVVCNYIRDDFGGRSHDMIDKTLMPQPWMIGFGPGLIDASNVLILGVIFVSDSAVMPLLAVR